MTSTYPKIMTNYGKHGNYVISIDSYESECLAWVAMFHYMCEQGYYYPESFEGDEPMAYDAAMKGDWKGARWFLDLRSGGEYEEVDIETVKGPRDLLEQLKCSYCVKCNQWLKTDRMRSFSGNIVTGTMPGHICKACDPWEKKDEG